eukprot:SAG31_NODE_521_length_14624_cov_34.536867_7_plen_803_part_00
MAQQPQNPLEDFQRVLTKFDAVPTHNLRDGSEASDIAQQPQNPLEDFQRVLTKFDAVPTHNLRDGSEASDIAQQPQNPLEDFQRVLTKFDTVPTHNLRDGSEASDIAQQPRIPLEDSQRVLTKFNGLDTTVPMTDAESAPPLEEDMAAEKQPPRTSSEASADTSPAAPAGIAPNRGGYRLRSRSIEEMLAEHGRKGEVRVSVAAVAAPSCERAAIAIQSRHRGRASRRRQREMMGDQRRRADAVVTIQSRHRGRASRRRQRKMKGEIDHHRQGVAAGGIQGVSRRNEIRNAATTKNATQNANNLAHGRVKMGDNSARSAIYGIGKGAFSDVNDTDIGSGNRRVSRMADHFGSTQSSRDMESLYDDPLLRRRYECAGGRHESSDFGTGGENSSSVWWESEEDEINLEHNDDDEHVVTRQCSAETNPVDAAFNRIFDWIQDTKSKVATIFNMIDSNDDGELDREEFKLAMDRMGLLLTPSEVALVIAKLDSDSNGTVSTQEFFARMREIGRARRRAQKLMAAALAALPKPKHNVAELLSAHERRYKRAAYAWADGEQRHWSTQSQLDLSNHALHEENQIRAGSDASMTSEIGQDTLGFAEMGLTPAEERLWVGMRATVPQKSGAKEALGPLQVVYAKTRRYVGLGLVLAQAGNSAAFRVKPASGGDSFWTTDSRLEVLPDLEPMSERAWDNWFAGEKLEAAGELCAAAEAYRDAMHAGGRQLWVACHYRAARCFQAAGNVQDAATHRRHAEQVDDGWAHEMLRRKLQQHHRPDNTQVLELGKLKQSFEEGLLHEVQVSGRKRLS